MAKTLLQEQQIIALKNIFSDHINNFFIVGGAVRDFLLGNVVKDFDICTTLSPNELISLCKTKKIKFIDLNKEYGTIIVVINNFNFEITSTRRDIKCYGRKADVVFSRNIEDDSKRRDFSINALYLDFSGKIYDFHFGLEDISNKRIKFIGVALHRINEDNLRLLRAFRFLSQLEDFVIEHDSFKAIIQHFQLVKNLSAERIRNEFLKLLKNKNAVQTLEILNENNLLKHIYQTDINIKIRISELVHIESALVRLVNFCDIDTENQNKKITERFALTRKERKLLSNFAKQTSLSSAIQQSKINFLLLKYDKNEVLNIVEYHFIKQLVSLNDLNFFKNYIQTITIPEFPIKTDYIIKKGGKKDKTLGIIISNLQKIWAQHNFNLSQLEIDSYLEQELRNLA